MARFSLDEGRSGSKRKTSCSEKEEDLKKLCVRGKGETSEPQEEESGEVGDEEVGGDGEVGDEVDDDGNGEETGEDGRFRGGNTNGKFNFSIDPDVLDCSICFEPLRPPIFQCRNGHIACPDCCPKLLNKCHICHQPIGHLRCIALEKVIESITIPCQYANYGCRAILSFTDKASHEAGCLHAELFCPISNCTFSGPKCLLSAHAKRKHCNISKSFSYNKPFMITLEKQQPFMVLLGEDGQFFLLLNSHENEFGLGNVLSVICMASNNPEHEFSYELRVRVGGSSLQLRTSPEKMKKWNGVHPCKAFLVVPDGFWTFSAHLSVIVSIDGPSEYL